MTDVGSKMVDISAPVANKTVDKIIVPTVKKVKNAINKIKNKSKGK